MQIKTFCYFQLFCRDYSTLGQIFRRPSKALVIAGARFFYRPYALPVPDQHRCVHDLAELRNIILAVWEADLALDKNSFESRNRITICKHFNNFFHSFVAPCKVCGARSGPVLRRGPRHGTANQLCQISLMECRADRKSKNVSRRIEHKSESGTMNVRAVEIHTAVRLTGDVNEGQDLWNRMFSVCGERSRTRLGRRRRGHLANDRRWGITVLAFNPRSKTISGKKTKSVYQLPGHKYHILDQRNFDILSTAWTADANR